MRFTFMQGTAEAALGLCFGRNDPSAGSPTETLLRLIPSLSVPTCTTSRLPEDANPENSSAHSIDGSGGRCVQKIGTVIS